MKKNKLLLLLALLLTAATGAWAQTETKLVTINSTGGNASFTSGSKTFKNIATVTFSGEVYNEGDEAGWYAFLARTLTVTAAEGYTITSCKFYTYEGTAMTGYTIEGESPSVYLTGGTVYTDASTSVFVGQPGISKIEVYGYAGTPEPAGPTSYTVSLKDGVKDADKWTVKVGEGQAQALPIGGLKGDGSETVTLQYNGRLKVKGVKATSDAAPAVKPAATLTEAPKPWDEYYVGDELLETLGTAEGGTLMYKLTTTNVKPTSTEGFSTENPKGVENAPSYKNYIWYYIKGDDTHSDSEIFGPIELDVWDS